MTLATRCSSCQTAFRVVKDQLLVSDGWVRCGRCSEVFNALEGLFDLERDTGPAPLEPGGEPPSPTARRVLDELARHGYAGAPVPPPEPDPVSPQSPDYQRMDDEVHGLPRTVDVALPSVPADAEPEPAAELSGPAGTVEAAPARADAPPAIVADAPAPRFVRAADRAAFWRRPWVRAGLSLCALLLTLVLGSQAAYAWRDALAAQVPALKPALLSLCDAMRCRIEPPRRIERLSVDSSGLMRIEGSSLYKLSLTLRNRADLAVMAPAIELSLTDTQGRLVARRVLSLREFGAPAPTLDAGQELSLSATLSAGERRISGYTVELFYP